MKKLFAFLASLFKTKSAEVIPFPTTQPTAPVVDKPEANPKPAPSSLTAPKSIHLKYGGRLSSGKWEKTIMLPQTGRFVEESHYSTSEDDHGFPHTVSEKIDTHLHRSFALIKQLFPEAIFETVYKQSWQKQWTPPENGLAGQGARGEVKPTVEQEMWQGNMMFAADSFPPAGEKYLVEFNGKSVVIQMGFEIGPGEEKYLGGLTREVHFALGTSDESQIKISYLKNQDLPLGPVLPSRFADATPWMTVAKAELGEHETGGNKDNARIVEYHQATTLKATDDETPWCSAFVCWCLQKAGYSSTKSAWARSYLSYGTKLEKPQYGCIVIYQRGTSSGHVHFFSHEKDGLVFGIGGNQGDSVSLSGYDKSRVLGYRWPSK